MVKAFFPKEWESSTPEDLAFNRARLAGFIEGIDNKEKDKVLREVYKIQKYYGAQVSEWSPKYKFVGVRACCRTDYFHD